MTTRLVCVRSPVCVVELIRVMGFRLLLLMGMGLGAMYMMHLLAQDYDKIRRPITKAIEAALRGKRDVNTIEHNEVGDIFVNWKSILDHDPFSCLQSLICQLMSGTQANDTEAIMFVHFLELTYRDAPPPVRSAYLRGLAYMGYTSNCQAEYPWCWYSAKTMLRLLRWFA